MVVVAAPVYIYYFRRELGHLARCNFGGLDAIECSCIYLSLNGPRLHLDRGFRIPKSFHHLHRFCPPLFYGLANAICLRA